MSVDNKQKNGQLPSQRVLYRGSEGGSIYTSENDGKFLVIIDESSMSALLPVDDLEGTELVDVVEFGSESERSEYLMSCFGPAH